MENCHRGYIFKDPFIITTGFSHTSRKVRKKETAFLQANEKEKICTKNLIGYSTC